MPLWRKRCVCDAQLLEEVAADQLETGREVESRKGAGCVYYFDRSALCTLALCRFMGQEPGEKLREAVAWTVGTSLFASRRVVLVLHLGFVAGNEVGKLSLEDTIAFQEVHRQTYEEYGFEIVELPKATVEERVQMVLNKRFTQ